MKRQSFDIKSNGKSRTIMKYTPEERNAHRRLAAVIRDAFDDSFCDSVHSYRIGYSSLTAIDALSDQVPSYKYFVKLDIKSFFPSVSRRRLAETLLQKLNQTTVNKAMSYVCASPTGIAEGSPLSPLLSNIYLSDLDSHIFEYGDVFYIRYCDDLLLLTNMNPKNVLSFAEREIRKNLLKPNKAKTVIGETQDGFDFLGFHMNTSGMWITREKIRSILERTKAQKSRKRRAQILNGWWAYCKNVSLLPETLESVCLLLMSRKYLSAYRMLVHLIKHRDKNCNKHEKQSLVYRPTFAFKKLEAQL